MQPLVISSLWQSNLMGKYQGSESTLGTSYLLHSLRTASALYTQFLSEALGQHLSFISSRLPLPLSRRRWKRDNWHNFKIQLENDLSIKKKKNCKIRISFFFFFFNSKCSNHWGHLTGTEFLILYRCTCLPPPGTNLISCGPRRCRLQSPEYPRLLSQL